MMDDLIKRSDAVNAVCELALSEEEAEEFAEAIENLPGVEVVPVEDGRYIRAGEVSAIVEDGKPVGFYRPEGPMEEIEDNPSVGVADTSLCTREAFEEAEHRAEVFERMAFKLGEEKKILLKIVRRTVGCGWCENHKKKFNEEPCRSCGLLASNFSPDFEKIERKIKE